MFEKPTEMRTAKSAGSPAFLAPELCVARHGDVSGRACDIWSMGISLYCFRYGRIPFKHDNVLDMYDAIRNQTIELPENESPELQDLFGRILERDPEKRIEMAQLRVRSPPPLSMETAGNVDLCTDPGAQEHPWVTRNGTDPLLSTEENCSALVEPPNDLEVNHAFTRRMSHLICVMKAISKFKGLVSSRGSTPRRDTPPATSTATGSQEVTPRQSTVSSQKQQEISDEDRQHAADAARLVEERKEFLRQQSLRAEGAAPTPESEPLILGIGTGGHDDFSRRGPPADVVSDSPTAVDFNVYDTAYESEVRRIQSQREQSTTVFLTKLLQESGKGDSDTGRRENNVKQNTKFADIVAQAVKDAKDNP
jgi:calcium/calmodulin-dependent protein kinase kinase 2